jgi:thiamine transport system ATP-binding protein
MRVTVKDVTKRFGTTIALENVSLEVGDGELVALVGPSGCGKTTLLRLIAGFEAPDAGDILFDGRSVLGVPPERRGIGLVFQNYALFAHMTVFQNVAYGLKFQTSSGLFAFASHRLAKTSGPGEAWRVRELLELVGLSGLEDRMPSELSAGQQQRVALARALAPNPQVLLLDEPLSALDAKLRERLRLEIKKIQRTLKITTIYVTHDQEEALAVGGSRRGHERRSSGADRDPQEKSTTPRRRSLWRASSAGGISSQGSSWAQTPSTCSCDLSGFASINLQIIRSRERSSRWSLPEMPSGST